MVTNRPDGMEWPPSFRRGVLPAIGLLVAFSLWVLISSVAFNWIFGQEDSLRLEAVWTIPSGLVQFGIVVAVYRYDGVELDEIGLTRAMLKPAAVAVVGVVVAVNAVIFGQATVAGRDISFGLYAFYRSEPYNLYYTVIALSALTNLVFTGAVEELAFRGYLQNKVVSMVDFGGLRLQTASSIVLTAVLFSVLHIPVRVVVDGVRVSELTGTLVLLALSGVIFGTIYALTQNLWLVILLHGVGNFWPVMMGVGRGIWPNYVVLLAIYCVLIVVYRQISFRTELPSPRPLGAAEN